jgi:hypothetical protein
MDGKPARDAESIVTGYDQINTIRFHERLMWRDPQSQAVGDESHGADTAEPQQHEPQ